MNSEEVNQPKWRRMFNGRLWHGAKAARAKPPILKAVCFTVLLGISDSAAQATPLTGAAFDKLASKCAPDVEVSTLRAVAAVESHLEPWALRDNTSHHTWTAQSLFTAVKLAGDRLKLGHSIDVGLMQINNGNFKSLGMSIENAFDECRSLAAGGRILRSAFSSGSSESERQAAILISLSRYNTGRALSGIANGYANEVIAAQTVPQAANQATRDMQNKSSQWDISGISGADSSSWIATADEASEIKRAGAQSAGVRYEGRAPVPPTVKGEPDEIFAFQESETSWR